MASAFPVAPPDEYVRPAPNWLTKALALSEADTERQRACDQAEVTSALFTSINESLIQSAPTSTYVLPFLPTGHKPYIQDTSQRDIAHTYSRTVDRTMNHYQHSAVLHAP